MATTPSERRALLFLSGLVLLGAGVRAVGAARANRGQEVQPQLQRQMEAVDSVRRVGRAGRGGGRGDIAVVGGRRRSIRAAQGEKADPRSALSPSLPVDLDRAQEWEIEALPRIGPALAKRIIADRDSAGPFGSMEEFRRVPGVGAKVARTLAPLVTFSLPPRHSGEVDRAGRTRATRKVRNRLRDPPPP